MGEPEVFANCLEWQFAPASDRAGMRGPAPSTMDGYRDDVSDRN